MTIPTSFAGPAISAGGSTDISVGPLLLSGAWALTSPSFAQDNVFSASPVSSSWAATTVTFTQDVTFPAVPVGARWIPEGPGLQFNAFQLNAFQGNGLVVQLGPQTSIVAAQFGFLGFAVKGDATVIISPPGNASWGFGTVAVGTDAIFTVPAPAASWNAQSPIVETTNSQSVITGNWAVVAPGFAVSKAVSTTSFPAAWALITPSLTSDVSLNVAPLTVQWALAPSTVAVDDVFSVTPVTSAWAVVTPTPRGDATASTTILSGNWSVFDGFQISAFQRNAFQDLGVIVELGPATAPLSASWSLGRMVIQGDATTILSPPTITAFAVTVTTVAQDNVFSIANPNSANWLAGSPGIESTSSPAGNDGAWAVVAPTVRGDANASTSLSDSFQSNAFQTSAFQGFAGRWQVMTPTFVGDRIFAASPFGGAWAAPRVIPEVDAVPIL